MLSLQFKASTIPPNSHIVRHGDTYLGASTYEGYTLANVSLAKLSNLLTFHLGYGPFHQGSREGEMKSRWR